MQIINYNLGSLVGGDIQIAAGDEAYVRRALHQKISFEEYAFLIDTVKYIKASDRFRDVIDLFKVRAVFLYLGGERRNHPTGA